MKYYKLGEDVYAFEDDGSQDDYITDAHILMSDEEVDRHLNPEKYLSDEEKLILSRKRMKQLTPMQFDLLLDANGLYDAVQDLVITDRKLKIAYTRATYFDRLDPFIAQAAAGLGLTDEQVDQMWLTA